MVAERNLEESADVGQAGREQSPRRACDAHRAPEGKLGHRQSGRGATRFEHRLIERRVVRGEEVGTVEQGCQLEPDRPERRRRFDVFPSDPVDVRELELTSRRTDQPALRSDDAPFAGGIGLDAYARDRTRAVAPGVGGLEVDGDEGCQDKETNGPPRPRLTTRFPDPPGRRRQAGSGI